MSKLFQTPSHEAQVAHVLRRTGFAARSAEIAAAADLDIHDLVDRQLARPGSWLEAAEAEQVTFDDDDYDLVQRNWLDDMMSPEAGLHERMVWFWHSHFTTNRDQTRPELMFRQHHLVRQHALGNVAVLARQLLEDGAMMHFLDASGSQGFAPNENLSREFLELFMVGRNAGYTEDDIKAGARILSGWWVNWEESTVHFEPDNHYDRPVRFLGTRQRWTLDQYVEAILALPACAEHLASRIHSHLGSTPLDDAERARLGAVLRDNDWEIRPLLAEILHADDFVNARGRRARQPVEWFVGAGAVYGFDRVEEMDFGLWELRSIGQAPFHPPNVAGWPDDDRWNSPTQVMARLNHAIHWDLSDALLDRVEPTVDAVLAHCGLHDVSSETRAALSSALDRNGEYDRGLDLLLALAVVCPEFVTC